MKHWNRAGRPVLNKYVIQYRYEINWTDKGGVNEVAPSQFFARHGAGYGQISEKIFIISYNYSLLLLMFQL